MNSVQTDIIQKVLHLVSEHFDVEYDDMMNLVQLHINHGGLSMPVDKKVVKTEVIVVNKQKYLYHASSRKVYSHTNVPKFIGYLEDDCSNIKVV